MKDNISTEILEKTKKMHPCYSKEAHDHARMHIPIAPKCNIQCNYCSRKYDCVNESRPGVTSEVLSPKEALSKFIDVKEKIDKLSVVGIAGPGDALENFEEVKKSIQFIKAQDENILFCLSTNGLRLPEFADEIIDLGVHHVTITINAVDPKIGSKIYDFVNDKGTILTGEEGAKVLLENQLKGLVYLSERGIICKVNIVLIHGINDNHVEEIVTKVKELGAYMTNIMPLIPAKGTKFEDKSSTNMEELNQLRQKCDKTLKQMYHCQQCRADAIGRLGQDISMEFRNKSCSKENESKNIIEKDIHEDVKSTQTCNRKKRRDKSA